MNCDDMIKLLNWYKATEHRVGAEQARLVLGSMLQTAEEALGTQTNGEATIPMPPCAEVEIRPRPMLFVPPEPQPPSSQVFRHMLTEREQEVLACIREGWANKRIAIKFDLTEATVKVHMKSILRKLQVANRTQAAVWALNNLPNQPVNE